MTAMHHTLPAKGALNGFQKAGDSAVEHRMRVAYEQLIRDGCGDVARWQAVHQLKPDAALSLVMLAMMRQGMDRAWPMAAQIVLELTISPAHLYAVCGDGVWFDEDREEVGFASRSSADRFKARFPEWVVGSWGERFDND